ncbi:MAG: penicillin acylase family protein [Bacteroidota bacterium]
MKLLKRIGLIFLLILALGCIGGYLSLQNKKPTLEGQLILTGLQETVEVYFDEFGVPHIYAQNEEDAQFALGYVHAQDRLFQMEMMRRLARGELAETLGPDLEETDRFFRTIGTLHSAQQASKAFAAKDEHDPIKRAALAYYRGVNQFMESGDTPLEFQLLGIPKRPFTVEDTYAIFGYMAFSFAQAFQTDPLVTRMYEKLGNDYLQDLDLHWNPTAQKIPVFGRKQPSESEATATAFDIHKLMESFPVAPWIGSNSWVLAPEKTKQGKVLFSNDTHMGFAQPSVWYEAHIECPEVSLYGTYLGGVPFSVTGHNRHHAVGLTMLENDDIDFYVEKINPENPNQVWFKDQWEDMDIRTEIIKVKDQEDIHIEVKTTRHGPIVNDVLEDISRTTQDPVSMWWIYNEFLPKNLEASYLMGRSSSMEQVREAVSIGHSPGLNVMYGDRDGNIAWWAMGKLPRRSAEVNSKLFLDGSSGEDEILGYVAFDDNPQSENPPTGYVYSANNQPDTTAGILHAGYFIPQDRADRIVELLEEEQLWDLEGMKRLVTDVYSPTMHRISQIILSQMRHHPGSNPLELRALEILQEWDGKNELQDIAPTIYTKIIFHIAKNCFIDELGEQDFETWLGTHMFKRSLPFLMQNPSSKWWDDIRTSEQESQADIIAAAVSSGIQELEAQLGSDPQQWQWQKVHSLEHAHALAAMEALKPVFNVGPLPVKGNIETINNMMFLLEGDGTYEVKAGPAKRRLIDFSDLDHALSILPTGQSGNLMSPHYSDQAQMFVDGEFRQMKMNEREIKQAEGHSLIMTNK